MTSFDIKDILIPTDFSETAALAIEHAARLTRLTKANLHLLHVIKVSDLLYASHTNATAIVSYANEHLNTLAKGLKTSYAINVSPVCKQGNPPAEIMKYVQDNNISMVIMGTHGASGFNEYFIGSNADKTIRKCECPVLTIQNNSHQIGFKNIVLPINNSYHSLEKVNRTVDLAKLYGAKIHLLGLINSDEEIEAKKFNIKLESIEKIIKHAEVNFERVIMKGENLAMETIQYTNNHAIDLIVVMSNDESEMNESFTGLFSKHIVNHVKVPVLSIKQKPAIYSSYSPT